MTQAGRGVREDLDVATRTAIRSGDQVFGVRGVSGRSVDEAGASGIQSDRDDSEPRTGPTDLDEAFRCLRARHVPSPIPTRLPTPAEVDEAEGRLGLLFPPDFRRYLLEVSDVECGGNPLEPVTITRPGRYNDLYRVAERAWNVYEIPRDWVPICEENGDFHCMTPAGEVLFRSRNGVIPEDYPTLASWIEVVWLDYYDEEPEDSAT